MPLWVVNTSGKGQVIVNASNARMASGLAGGDFGGTIGTPRVATQADVDRFPLMGTLLSGNELPASQADPTFVAGFGFTIPASAQGGGATKPQQAPPSGKPPGFTPEEVDEIVRGLDRPPARGPGFIPPGGAPSNPLLPTGLGGGDDQTGGGGPLGLTGGLPPPPDLSPRDLVNTLFRRGLGARLGSSDLESSIVGRAALGRQPQFENVFGFQRGLAGFQSPSNVGGVQADQNQAFEDFVRSTSGGMLGQEAAHAFRVLSGGEQGAVPAATAEFRKQFGGANEDQANQLAQLVMSALSAGVSPLALNLLRLPSGEDLRSRFIAETGGGPEANFIKFLQANFPLASTIR